VKFSILISDKQYLTKVGMRSIIENDTKYYLADGEPGPPSQWETSLTTIRPDIFITDYFLYEHASSDDLYFLEKACVFTKILIISDDQDGERVKNVIDFGVKGFLTKHCSPTEIEHTLAAISSGGKFFCHEVMDLIITENKKPESAPILKELSDRELEVLSLIGRGLTSREISEKLIISIHTVNSHRKNLLRKLNMKSPAQLIVFALENML